MKTLCIVTSNRAEYGLLRPVIEKFHRDKDIELRLVVTGAHLSKDFGNTVTEIIQSKVPIHKCIPILEEDGREKNTAYDMARCIKGFSDYFSENKSDGLMILGDRYEILGVAIAAMNHNIAIIHLHGGEITAGAIDDYIRHSITKMSRLHFTSTEKHRKRVIQMGEMPSMVHNVGALGVENIKHMNFLSKEEVYESLNLPWESKFAVVTFHPETTLDPQRNTSQLESLIQGLEAIHEMYFVITGANADQDGARYNRRFMEKVETHPQWRFFHSLGSYLYLNAVKYATMVIGNSSSGIIEVPSFHIPVINIGNRQLGRDGARDICHIPADEALIRESIQSLSSPEYNMSMMQNPYEKAGTAESVFRITKECLLTDKLTGYKEFYDMEF